MRFKMIQCLFHWKNPITFGLCPDVTKCQDFTSNLKHFFCKMHVFNILTSIFSWIPGQDSEEEKDTEVPMKRHSCGKSGLIRTLHKTETKGRRLSAASFYKVISWKVPNPEYSNRLTWMCI